LQQSRKLALRKLHLGLDALLFIAAMGLAFGLHTGLRDLVPALKVPPPFQMYTVLAALTLPLWLGLTALLGLHRSFERPWSRAGLIVELVKLHTLGLVGLALVIFVTQTTINRSLVVLFLTSSALLMYAQRSAISAWVRYQHRLGHGQEQILLVGTPSRQMAAFLKAAKLDSLAPHVLGYLGDKADEREDNSPMPEHLGALPELDTFLHEQAVDQVIFFAPYDRPEWAPDALKQCEELGVRASFSIELAQLADAAPRVVYLHDHAFISFDVAPKGHAALATKHAIDSIAAAIGLVLVSPILLLTSLAILITMGRPIFFTQERAGLFGRRFRMYKFRSMVRDAEAGREALEEANEMDGPVFKVSKDPRITRLGHFLRKSSIDELPQLFNVVTGTMSLIGPRPLPRTEQEQIRGWQRRRLSMKPGITGLWQVSGRSDIDFDEWMALDLRYIDEWSLGFDLGILLRTIPVVLLGRGAR
jgi:exopolysaccharide biosynthesis polyprenyl glycosylphosphotransferase